MTSPRPQGELTVERMCALAGVSRAGYYRRWQASAPRQKKRRFATRSSVWCWPTAVMATGVSRRSCAVTAWWRTTNACCG